jgi:polysaccharide biosynthesis/export protein
MITYPESVLNAFRSFIIPALTAIVLLASCTPQRRLTYIQDPRDRGDELEVKAEEYRLNTGDILHVRVMSADAGSTDIFNMDGGRQSYARAGEVGDQLMYIYGYTIDQNGEIQLPVIGNIRLAGLSLAEAHKIVQSRAAEYIVDAAVAVKIANFSVTVLGEVMRPGNFYVYDNYFTVMDAIGAAGDLTDYGNRRVHIVRRTDDGVKFHRLDITDRGSFTSELYYLQPNDLVYVEPLISKRFGFAQFPFGVFFSAITTALLLLNFFN